MLIKTELLTKELRQRINTGHEYCEIRPYYEPSTNDQRRVYRAWIKGLTARLGYNDEEELHRIIKVQVGFFDKFEVDGVDYIELKTTGSSTSTKELADFMRKVELWAHEQGQPVPQPNTPEWSDWCMQTERESVY